MAAHNTLCVSPISHRPHAKSEKKRKCYLTRRLTDCPEVFAGVSVRRVTALTCDKTFPSLPAVLLLINKLFIVGMGTFGL